MITLQEISIFNGIITLQLPQNRITCGTKKNIPKLFKAKARLSTIKDKCKLIFGTRQLANLL